MPGNSHQHAGWDTAPPRHLRPLGAFAKESWNTLRYRGGAIISIAVLVWIVFAVYATALIQWSVDLPRVGSIYSRLLDTSVASNPGALNQDVEAFVSGDWLKAGWWGLVVALLCLAGGYLLSSAVATIAVTHQSYAWMAQRKRLHPLTSIRYGLRRALPGASLLGTYLVAVICVVVTLLTFGAALGIFLADIFLTAEPAAQIAAGLIGGLLGGVFGIVMAIWVYTRWSLSPYAVALSSNPWTGLRQSARLTKGHRLDVLIRLILVLVAVGFALAAISLPVDLILGFLPLMSSALLPLVLVLYVRIIISALSPLLSAASFTTMYVDLGGDTSSSSDAFSPLG